MKLEENKYWSDEEDVVIDSLERNTTVIVSSCNDEVCIHIHMLIQKFIIQSTTIQDKI